MRAFKKNLETLEIEDWVLVKFTPQNLHKLYFGQVTDTKPYLQLKFARRSSFSTQFHRPGAPDISTVSADHLLRGILTLLRVVRL